MDGGSDIVVYTGTFHRSFDEKGRLTIPADWRSGDCATDLFVAPSKEEGLLRVYPFGFIKRRLEAYAAQPPGSPQREQFERLVRVSQRTTCDAQGRIMVNEELRRRVGKVVVLAGGLNHFSIQRKADHRDEVEPIGFEIVGL